jgi:hypothetical protein
MKRLALVMILTAAAIAAPGCKQRGEGEAITLQNFFKKLSGPSPQQRVAMAFDPDNADNRREGVTLLSRKDWGLQEPYLKGYAGLLAADDHALVRCAAVRALGKAGDPTYFKDIVEAMSDESPAVRWDAAVAVDQMLPTVREGGGEIELAFRPLQNHATKDPSVDVRTAAAKGLRHFRKRDSVRALVNCLDDAEMGLRYQAHLSLVELTGQDHGYAAAAWRPLLEGDIEFTPLPKPRRSLWDWTRRKRKTPEPTPPKSSSTPANEPRP